MPFPKILNNSEIKIFDSSPKFNSEDRKINFNLPRWAQEELQECRNDENKLIFILLFGYFKYCRKFFVPSKFNEKDINYVIYKYNLSIKSIDIQKYSRMTILRYQEIILNGFGVSAFDEMAKQDLIKEADIIVSKKFKMKAIFHGLLDYLDSKKIEIPTYNVLAEIITNAINTYEKSLLENMEKLLNVSDREILDNLLEKIQSEPDKDYVKLFRYKLTHLKKIPQTTKPVKIKENVNNLNIFKNMFYKLEHIIQKINLSPETIEYYAKWALKAKIFQVLRKDDIKRYLYLLAFIIHQYFTLQDILIDTLISVIHNISNTTIREHKENYYQKRNKRENAVIEVVTNIKDDIFIIKRIRDILFDSNLNSDEKVEAGQHLFSDNEEAMDKLLVALDNVKTESESILKGNDYFEILETKSIKLQNRVAEIVKNIEFNKETSNKKLIDAIEYYKLKDGAIDHKAPDEFIDDDKKIDSLIDNKGKFRVSLYKVFLFEEIAKGIKSDALNLKYSYKYKAMEEYMINKEIFKKNKCELLKRCGLEDFAEPDIVLKQLQKIVEHQYTKTNRNIITGKNEYISFKTDKHYILQTPKTEKSDIDNLIELFPQHEHIPLFEILSVVNQSTNFLDSFEHYNLKHTREKPDKSIFLSGITGYGCNIGTKRIPKISRGISEYELDNTVNWYFSVENINSANNKILSFINQLNLPNIFKKNKKYTHTASDGQKYPISVDSFTGNSSFKYFGKGKGVSVYSFIDERHLLFYSTVISSSEREAGYVIDGLMNNDVIQSDIHSTDTHGYSEIVFGLTHLLGYSFAPRIKDFRDQYIYCFNSESKKSFEEKGYKILPNAKNYINVKAIKENWDDILRLIVTIKLRHTDASQLMKRLSSYSKKHRLYQALKNFGQIIKTIFLLKYIDDVRLRQAIEKQLNKIESAHKFARAIFFGNNEEFNYVTKDEQDIAEGCKRLIENAIVCWNYMYLSQKVADTQVENERNKLLETIKKSSVVVWKHINLYGEYNFSEKNFKPSFKFDIPKILELEVA